MKGSFSLLLKDNLIRKSLLVFLAILILFIIIYVVKFRDLPPQLPLFYSLPRGNEQLGNPILLALLPIFSILIEIINIIIGGYVYAEEILLARILMIIGSFINVLLFITFIKIVFTVS